ncbi:uncharacterized protein LOC109815320 [Cajanus cajan]|uniref:uncharacterized protein LOC109815320 n=1 Tax=Cajanus cajan TaxID=3821 RepID=UPI00098DBAFF|nr:uncharacterized protein LOC109815320 [Cajanus cajan]
MWIVTVQKKTDGNTGDEEIEGLPAKVLWYFPIIPKFKRLFAIKEDAKNLTWQENGRKVDKFLRHPVNSPQWKRIDEKFPEFGIESRNLRIGLATDDMNPYGNLTYGNLSRYSVKGHYACPICEENTSYTQLKHWKKIAYTRHRKFLVRSHPYRRLKKTFNGCKEDEIASTPRNGEQVYERVKNINIVFGKTQKKSIEKNIWKKRSIFFNLPYWCKLDVRHCIDVMHVEKNVCDNVIETLLNIKGKTKGGVKARQDLVDMGIRSELHIQFIGKCTYLPPSCHTLSKNEKKSFCECLCNVKVPQGYSSNVKSLVFMQDLKLIGLKSHNCHVLMQQFLPVIIRNILPFSIRVAITRLCLFFNAICKKVTDTLKLDELENEAITILCQLEMYFPPSFFDIMVHLIVHLVREIQLCGPIYLRWMYPVERYMKIFKGYVKNQYRPEASIVERLARRPNNDVITFGGYDINKYCFYTKIEDDKSRVQNSGVTIQAESVHFASSKDKNLITTSMSYFRVIQDIWEIAYVTFRLPLLKCERVDGNTGVWTNDLGFTLVDLNKVGYKVEPFIMAYQVRKNFYVRDPCNEKWSVVLEGRTMHETHEDESLDMHETPSFSSTSFCAIADNEVDEMHAIRSDHDEGIW